MKLNYRTNSICFTRMVLCRYCKRMKIVRIILHDGVKNCVSRRTRLKFWHVLRTCLFIALIFSYFFSVSPQFYDQEDCLCKLKCLTAFSFRNVYLSMHLPKTKSHSLPFKFYGMVEKIGKKKYNFIAELITNSNSVITNIKLLAQALKIFKWFSS